MEKPHLVRHSLIAGHAALAMLAVAAIHLTSPVPVAPQWQAAGRLHQVIGQMPRRLPTSRRTDRAFGEPAD